MLTLDAIINTTKQMSAYGEAGHCLAKGSISLAQAGVKAVPERPKPEQQVTGQTPKAE